MPLCNLSNGTTQQFLKKIYWTLGVHQNLPLKNHRFTLLNAVF